MRSVQVYKPKGPSIEVTVTLHEETSSISPFGQADWHASFTSNRVAIETTTGNVISERSKSIFYRSRYGYALGSASPCVLYGIRAMDLPHDAILYDNARLRG